MAINDEVLALDKKFNENVSNVIDTLSKMDGPQTVSEMYKEAKHLRALLEKKDEFIIHLAGNVGLGKTTVAETIGTHADMHVVYEDTEDALLKDHYYKDKRAFGADLQKYNAWKRYTQLLLERKDYARIVVDRSPYEDPLVFTPALHRYQMIESEKEVERCELIFGIVRECVQRLYPLLHVEPNLIILVEGGREVGQRRKGVRGRPMEKHEEGEPKEKGLPIELYELLDAAYQTFIPRLREKGWYTGPVLRLKQDHDISNAEHTKGIVYILKCLAGALEIMDGK